ncbi:uncharacterized protein LOC141853986 [Brevipalpus obovatus]|uniref:uncharacterized protein LOC141853986 n=1 Tax=Brevipalpus obovatus TaxID=246614 RepID=UPI003D9E9DFD
MIGHRDPTNSLIQEAIEAATEFEKLRSQYMEVDEECKLLQKEKSELDQILDNMQEQIITGKINEKLLETKEKHLKDMKLITRKIHLHLQAVDPVMSYFSCNMLNSTREMSSRADEDLKFWSKLVDDTLTSRFGNNQMNRNKVVRQAEFVMEGMKRRAEEATRSFKNDLNKVRGLISETKELSKNDRALEDVKIPTYDDFLQTPPGSQPRQSSQPKQERNSPAPSSSKTTVNYNRAPASQDSDIEQSKRMMLAKLRKGGDKPVSRPEFENTFDDPGIKRRRTYQETLASSNSPAQWQMIMDSEDSQRPSNYYPSKPQNIADHPKSNEKMAPPLTSNVPINKVCEWNMTNAPENFSRHPNHVPGRARNDKQMINEKMAPLDQIPQRAKASGRQSSQEDMQRPTQSKGLLRAEMRKMADRPRHSMGFENENEKANNQESDDGFFTPPMHFDRQDNSDVFDADFQSFTQTQPNCAALDVFFGPNEPDQSGYVGDSFAFQ